MAIGISSKILREALNLVEARLKPGDQEAFERFRFDLVIAIAKLMRFEPQAFYDLVVLNRRSYRKRA